MDKFVVRRAVARFILAHIRWGHSYRVYYSQSELADILNVRSATVSDWVHLKSDIGLFTFLRICQAFAVKGNSFQDVFFEFFEFLSTEIRRKREFR